MKKITFLTTLCFMAFSLFAQDLVIPKMLDVPVIDGEVDEIWGLIDQVDCEFEPSDDFGDVSIYESWFKMGWNDTALFMLMRRDDDDFADQWETGLADWQSDRDEIFFDVNVQNLADGRGASDGQTGGTGADFGHYQFTSIWVQNAEDWIGMPQQWYHNAPYHMGYVRDGDAYFTEYAFPFTSLTINTELLTDADETFQGDAGVIFGLQVVFIDVDMADEPTDQTFRKFIKLIDEGGWELMDAAAHVELGSEEVSIPSSVENVTAGTISVYPSPAVNYIQVNGLSQDVTVEIYDVVGSLVMVQDHVNSDSRISLYTLKSGVYFIRVADGATVKFIKK